jgi:2-methylcitrate dehydratase
MQVLASQGPNSSKEIGASEYTQGSIEKIGRSWLLPKQEEKEAPYRDLLASYIERVKFDDLSNDAVVSLKHHVLDSIGCAINALTWESISNVRDMLEEEYEFNSSGRCSLIGFGKRKTNAVQLAAFWNTSLTRYVDFMDSYMAKMQTCHPSDNLGSILSSSEYRDQGGRDFLTALGIAYHVHCRFMDAMPLERKSFDHTVQLAISISSGCSRSLGLNLEQTANAISMAGSSTQGLDVSRSGYLSNWKGLASAQAALSSVNCVMMASKGVTGPSCAFEGPHGVFDAFGDRFMIDWSKEDCERVTKTCIKKYNVEMHNQSLIVALLELRRNEKFKPDEVKEVRVETFAQANNITGSGKLAGNKYDVRTKDQADHSIPYACAASIISGDLYPDQYRQEMIKRSDIQELLHKVVCKENKKYSRMFPEKIACKVTIKLNNRRKLSREKTDYKGMFSRPMPVEKLNEKFRRLTSKVIDSSLQDQIISTVLDIENRKLSELTQILSKIDVRSKELTPFLR